MGFFEGVSLGSCTMGDLMGRRTVHKASLKCRPPTVTFMWKYYYRHSSTISAGILKNRNRNIGPELPP